ncbi:hypothetical protein QLH52_15020, partial [Methylomonas sp. OY6]
ADDSVAGCHVKVGHRQALKPKALLTHSRAFFLTQNHPTAAPFSFADLLLPDNTSIAKLQSSFL